jgi:superfamily I DNA/RNA helicase
MENLMPYVDATICGVPIKKLSLMNSKFAGYDTHTGQRFNAGEQIAYLAATFVKQLPPAQIEAIFPNGKISAITVQWPMQETAATKFEPASKITKSETTFKPTSHQDSIWDCLFTTEDHILIEALAGAGKTSTLVWLVKQLAQHGLVTGRQIIYLAFNRKIKIELSEKLEGTGVPAMTTHGFGYQLLKRRFGQKIEPHNGKVANNAFLRIVCDDNGLRPTSDGMKAARKCGEYKFRSPIMELVGYTKNWAIFPAFTDRWAFSSDQEAVIQEFIEVYEIDFDEKQIEPSELVKYACRVICETLPTLGAGSISEVDFDDMLYLPHVLELPMPKYDLILTDESQDFNNLQILLLEKLVRE